MFIASVMGSVYQTIGDLYFIYWFQDEVGQDGFEFFHHHIANSTQTKLALSLSALPNQIIALFTLPAGWMADKLHHERCLVCCIGSPCLFPLINAFYPNYTAVILTSVGGAVIGGTRSL